MNFNGKPTLDISALHLYQNFEDPQHAHANRGMAGIPLQDERSSGDGVVEFAVERGIIFNIDGKEGYSNEIR